MITARKMLTKGGNSNLLERHGGGGDDGDGGDGDGDTWTSLPGLAMEQIFLSKVLSWVEAHQLPVW